MDVLTGRTIKSSNYFSRYNGFSYYYNKLSEKKIPIKDKYGNISVDNTTGEVLFQTEGKYNMSTSSWLKDTDDYIALKKYNNPTQYWIICDFNRIIDPFKEPKPGDILYLPAKGKDLEFEHY